MLQLILNPQLYMRQYNVRLKGHFVPTYLIYLPDETPTILQFRQPYMGALTALQWGVTCISMVQAAQSAIIFHFYFVLFCKSESKVWSRDSWGSSRLLGCPRPKPFHSNTKMLSVFFKKLILSYVHKIKYRRWHENTVVIY